MNRFLRVAATLLCLSVPAAAQEREWSFDLSEDEAFLIFGVPESDDVGISFWCTLRSGEVRMFIPEASEKLKPNKKVKFAVNVAGRAFTLTGNALPNEEAGTTSIEGSLQADGPVFAAMRKADRFSTKILDDEQTFPLNGADFDELLSACGKP